MSDEEVVVKFGYEGSGLDRGILTASNELGTLRQALAGVADAAVPAAEASSQSMAGLALSTSQARREVIVLGHELMTGNFSRIPGSLLVLGERMGGLSASTLGTVGVVAALGFALYELASNAEHTAEAVNQMQAAMGAEGKTTLARDQIESYISTLSKLPGISTEAARTITSTFEDAANVSQSSAEKLMSIVNDYAFVTREKAPQAAADLVKMSEDPMRAAEKLAETYQGILTPAQFQSIQSFSEMGDKMAAMDVIADAMATRFANLKENGLAPAEVAANSFGNALSWIGEKVGALIGAIPKLASQLNGLSADMAGVGDESDKVAERAEATAATQKQVSAEMDATVIRSLQTSKKIIDSMDEEGKLRQQLKEQTQGALQAGIQGETQEQAEIQKSIGILQTKINKIEEMKSKKAEAEQRQKTQGAASEISGDRGIEEQKFQGQADNIKLLADMNKTSLAQEYSDLQANLAAEAAATEKSFDEQLELYSKDSKEYEKVSQQKELSEQQFQNKKLLLEKQGYDAQVAETKKAAEEEKKSMDTAFRGIESSLNTMVRGVLTGTQTMSQMFMRLASNLVLTMADAFVKMGLDFIKSEAVQVQGQVAADAAKLASQRAAAAQGKVEQDAAASSSILKDAESAAAGTYSSVAQIPYVGWILAPPAAAAAFATVAAYDSFDVGTPNVPRDMIAQIHQGEAIVPAKQAQAWRDGDLGLGAKENGGESHTHFHINAMDGNDVAKTLAKHGTAITAAVRSAARGGNSSIRSALKGR